MIEPRRLSDSSSRADALELTLRITDPEAIEELEALGSPAEQADHALRALRIGLMALRTARGRIDAEAVKREGDAILAKMSLALNGQREWMQSQIEGTLKSYFDPQSGAFERRMRGLLARDGELETVLQRQVGVEGSALAKTLRSHLGPESEIMKRLSPGDADGLFQQMLRLVEDQLRGQRDKLLAQFSLDADDTALARLVTRIQGTNAELGDGLSEKVDALVKELSLDQEASGLKRLRDELMGVLTEHGKAEAEFRAHVLGRLGEMEGAKQTAERTTLKGLSFEQALFAHVEGPAAAAGMVASFTGSETGLIKGRKFGDVVIEMGPDTAAPGARVVIEAKDESGRSLASALAELEHARKNRGADVGVFVFRTGVAPDGLDAIKRFGRDVVVAWDPDDAQTNVSLEAALSLAQALCTRDAKERDDHAVDLVELDKAILEVEKRSEGLDEIRKSAETILSSGSKIKERVRIQQDAFARQVKVLRDVLSALRDG